MYYFLICFLDKLIIVKIFLKLIEYAFRNRLSCSSIKDQFIDGLQDSIQKNLFFTLLLVKFDKALNPIHGVMIIS